MEHPNVITFSNSGYLICTGNDNAEIDSMRSALFSVVNKPDSLKQGSKASSRMWSLEAGKQLYRIRGHHAWKITSQAFSTDDKLLASTGYRYSYREQQFRSRLVPTGPDFETRLWDTAHGEEIASWEKTGGALAFSGSGSSLVATSPFYGVQVLKPVKGGSVSKYDIVCSDEVSPIPLTSDSHMLILTGLSAVDGNFTKATPAIIDISTGVLLRRYTSPDLSTMYQGLPYNDFEIHAMAIDSAFKKLAVVTGDHIIVWQLNFDDAKLRDREQQVELVRIPCKQNAADLHFTDDSKHLVIAADSGHIDRVSLLDGTMQTLWRGAKGTYQISPNGRYLSQTSSDREAGYWDLLELDSGKTVARFHQPFKDQEWGIETPDGNQIVASRISQNIGIDQAEIVIATLRKSIRDISEKSPAKGERVVDSKPNLFVVAVGVGQHRHDSRTLKFAAKDAKDLAALLKKQEGSLYNEVYVNVLTDQTAQLSDIVEALTQLKRSCTSRDRIVILFSGHGESLQQGLYLQPWNGNKESIALSYLNWNSVIDLLVETKAEHALLLLDCCHAGAMDVGGYTRATEASRKITVFCSSDREEVASESTELRNGLFVGLVLKGLSGSADFDQDGTILVEELTRFGLETIPAYSNRKQNPKVLFSSGRGVSLFRVR